MMSEIEAQAMLRESRIAAYVITIGGAVMCIVAYFVMKAIQ